jgi:NADH-quinone oxidoreductase subunit J
VIALLAPTALVVRESDLATVTGPRVVFWVLSALVVGGALMTVTRRNAIAAVMSLVATFFGLAGLYALLSAHFIAVLQVLVYAGAIMVLFIFVVMVLNRDEIDPWVWRGFFSKLAVGAAPMMIIAWVVGGHLSHFQPPHPDMPPESFGTISEVGSLLFTDYLFAFEAVSVLLLVAVIAAVVLARVHRHEPPVAAGPASPEAHG